MGQPEKLGQLAYIVQYDASNNITFPANITASSIIKSGGTATQILAADGSVITAGTNITISGGTISASGSGGGMAIGGSITSATAGSVLFAGTSGVLAQNNANFNWDNTNGRLQITNFNLTNSQLKIGSLEIQSYSLNNSWFSDNMYFNGTNFVYRSTGKAVLFYFYNGEGQFRSYASGAAGSNAPNVGNGVKLKFNELGSFGVGLNVNEADNNFSGSFLRVFPTGNVTINQATTDSGFRLDVNGTARVQGNLTFGTSTSYLFGDANNIRLYDKNNFIVLQAFPSGVSNSETYLQSSSGAKIIKLNDNAISLEWYNSSASNNIQNPIQVIRGYIGNVTATDKSVLYVKSNFFSNLSNATTLRGIYIDINDTTTYTGFTTVRAIEAPRGGAYFNTTAPNASSVLQADSTTQGFLPPRMTTAQRDAIASPATGLMVYNISSTALQVYNGTSWGSAGASGNIAIGDTITSATAGSILFAGTSGVLAQDNANFFWDDTNNRLGLGTATPTQALTLQTSSINASGIIALFKTTLNDYAAFQVQNSSAAWQFSVRNIADSNSSGFNFYYSADGSTGFLNVMTLTKTGNVAIGTDTIGSKFQVNGNAAIGYSASTAAPTNGLAVSGNTTIGGILTTNNGTNSTNGIKIVSSLTSSLFTGGIEFIRTTVAAGSKIEPFRDATNGGVGLRFLTTTSNANEVSGTYNPALTILNNGSATFSSSLSASNFSGSSSGTNTGDQTLAGLGGQPQLNGTGFVKATGTSISYDNSTYYLASNPSGFITSAALSSYLPLSGGTLTGSVLITASSSVSLAFAFSGASYAQLFQSTSTGYTLGYGASATTIGTPVLTWTSNNNNVGIGTINPVATAALQISSTTQGFLPPVMTTTQKNAITSPATGLVVFDSTLSKLCVFSGTWQTITSV